MTATYARVAALVSTAVLACTLLSVTAETSDRFVGCCACPPWFCPLTGLLVSAPCGMRTQVLTAGMQAQRNTPPAQMRPTSLVAQSGGLQQTRRVDLACTAKRRQWIACSAQKTHSSEAWATARFCAQTARQTVYPPLIERTVLAL